MGNKEPKFEEALYCNGTVKHTYSLNEIAEIYENDRKRFENEVRMHLFCPECYVARLKFNPGHHHQQHYLSTADEHLDNCSFKCSPVPTTTLRKIDEKPDLYNLQTRLGNCLYRFLKGKKTVSNPCILCQENNPLLLRDKKTQPVRESENLYIPRRRLTHDICQDISNSFMIYYGAVELEWHGTENASSTKDWYPHKLHIFLVGEKQPICILRFSDNVFNYLPDNIRKYGAEAKRFKALTAFYTSMSEGHGPWGEVLCEAKINDSRKIKFLEDSAI